MADSLLKKLSSAFSFQVSSGGGGSCIGVSLGSSSLKVAELKRVGKGWKLVHFGLVQVPDDTFSNREILNAVPVVENLKQLVAQMHLGSKNICTSVSGNSVIIKRMSVEAPNARELKEQVFWEAEQYLPFDVSEVVMDFHMIAKGKDNKTDVLLVAVKRALAEAYIGCIEDAGLKVKVVDTDYFALQNAFEANYPMRPSEAVCLVDVGAVATKIEVVQDGIPIFTKDSALGGQQLTQEIQRSLSLSYSDAETLKVGGQSGGIPQEVLDLMNIASENLATEVKRTLEFYNASASGAQVSYVLLAGGGAKVPGLSKIVEDQTGLPTQILNPFNAITYDPGVFTPEYIAGIGPLAAIPIGLAIRGGEG